MIVVSIQWYINSSVYHKAMISPEESYQKTYELVKIHMQQILPNIPYTVFMTDGFTYKQEMYQAMQVLSRTPIQQTMVQNWRYN